MPRPRSRRALAFAAVASVVITAAGCSVSKGTNTAAQPSKSAAIQISVDGYHGPESTLGREYPTGGADATQKPFTVGYLNPVAGNENLMAMQRAAEAETKRLGGRFIAKDDQNDVSTQLKDFNELLAQGVNAILVYPLDPKALGPSLAAAKSKGIPVIGYDVTNTVGEPLPDGYTSQILQARDWQAWLMAKAMAEAKPGGQVGLIGISIPVPGLKYLVQRVSYWAGQLGLHVVGEVDNNQGDSASGGQAAATALLGAHPKLDGIIAFNDPTAVGAAAAAKLAASTVAIVGNNGDSNGVRGVRSGQLIASFQNDAVGQGVQGVLAAQDALRHVAIPPTVVRPPLIAITAANADQVRSWDQQIAAVGG
jgi:ABC-type sugar transport system substrate-binding protein